MGYFSPLGSSRLFILVFNQRILYGVLLLATLFWGMAIFLQPTHPIRGCFVRCGLSGPTFNQRTLYGVLLELIDDLILDQILQPTHPVWGASTAKVNQGNLQPTHPIRGCFVRCGLSGPAFNQRILYGVLRFLLFCNFARYTFNQRTQYMVLRANCYYLSGRGLLQPTHPVWGASCQRESDYPLYEPSTNAPSMWCFCFRRWSKSAYIPFNQRTQYGVLQFLNLNSGGILVPSTNAPSMGCFCKIHRYISFRAPSTNAPSMGCFHNRPR